MTEHPAFHVVRETLLRNSPFVGGMDRDLDPEATVNHQARRVVDRLIADGYLAPHVHVPTAEDVAWELSQRAGTPAATARWRDMLTNTGTVDYAHRAACDKPGADTQALNALRDYLHAHIRGSGDATQPGTGEPGAAPPVSDQGIKANPV